MGELEPDVTPTPKTLCDSTSGPRATSTFSTRSSRYVSRSEDLVPSLSSSLCLLVHLRGGSGLLIASCLGSLAGKTLLSPFTRSLVLRTLGVHLFLEDSLTLFLSLGLVNLHTRVSVVL